MDQNQMSFAYDRRRTSTLTLDEQPGAHTGVTRKYIPGYSDANIIFRAPTTGNDANDGLTEGAPKLSQSSSETAAGTTKKIRIIENCTISDSITKPTEMKRGFTGTLASSLTAPVETFNNSASTTASRSVRCAAWSQKLKLFAGGGEGASNAAYFVYSANGTTWSESASTGADGAIHSIVWSDVDSQFVAVGFAEYGASPFWYSSDGTTWTRATFATEFQVDIKSVAYSKELGIYVAGGTIDTTNKLLYYSYDGITWVVGQSTASSVIYGIDWSPELEIFVGVGQTSAAASYYIYSTDGVVWTDSVSTTADRLIESVAWSPSLSTFVGVGYIPSTGASYYSYSTNGTTWANSASTSATTILRDVKWVEELSKFVAVGSAGTASAYSYSTNGTTWTISAATTANREVLGGAWSLYLGLFVGLGYTSTGASYYSYSTAYSSTISAHVAGFTLQAMQYSGTVSAYNCSLKQPGTTAALSLEGCRVEYDSHISNNAVTSLATLYRGDRHTTCTPVNTNDIDMNLDTVGGTWYIYNASQTGYERIRDCIVEGGIVASFPVTVSGRANTRGTSENVMFGATVTHNDPKFVNTTDYQLQFQTNGYSKNSPAAGRSAIYFNSAGGTRDIGAWSYIESGVSYFYAKNRYLFKGEITHGLEFNLTEQQGDSGVINVYGNVNRIKEVLTIQYGDTRPLERAVFDEMLLLEDKSVKIAIDAEWDQNSGTVTVNGNQSAGVEYLTVDAVATFNGMTVTISGKQYLVMRSSPNTTAATRLILDRPTEDAVSDNDVLVTNYPSGQGEYQFAGPTNLVLKRKAPTSLTGWQTGFAIRLVRKKQ